MSEVIRVGMAEMKICMPQYKITTLGLGSCVGAVIYDSSSRICGMVHVMLPDSRIIRNNGNKAKFADLGIEMLVKELISKGAVKSCLKAKIAGGAQMFSFKSESELLQVGKRNVEAVGKKLKELGIPIVASDVGGNYGRTITFNPDDFKLEIKVVGRELSYI